MVLAGHLTYDFAPPGVAIPLLVLCRRHHLEIPGLPGPRNCTGNRTGNLGSGASLWLAAPNPVARSCSLSGPLHAVDVPVQAPGPGRPQHRALAGAQGALKLVQCRGMRGGTCTHRINTQSIKSTSTWHAIHLCASTNRYRSIYSTTV